MWRGKSLYDLKSCERRERWREAKRRREGELGRTQQMKGWVRYRGWTVIGGREGPINKVCMCRKRITIPMKEQSGDEEKRRDRPKGWSFIIVGVSGQRKNRSGGIVFVCMYEGGGQEMPQGTSNGTHCAKKTYMAPERRRRNG